MTNSSVTPGAKKWRRLLLAGWLVVGVVYALELGWLGSRKYALYRNYTGALTVTATQRESDRGSLLVCWAERDSKVVFVVLEGPFSRSQGLYVGDERVWLKPGGTPNAWLQVTRSDSVPADRDPPHLFHFHDDRFDSAPLPPGFSKSDLADFLATPSAFDGTAGLVQWIANPVRPKEHLRVLRGGMMPDRRPF